jgi:hypothetical protein
MELENKLVIKKNTEIEKERCTCGCLGKITNPYKRIEFQDSVKKLQEKGE